MKKIPPFNISSITIRELTNYQKLEIPFFQRNYSWTEKEISQFFNDLIDCFENKEDNYLLGNIQLLTFNRRDFLIIDGQQRLTTFFLVLESLEKNIKKYEGLKNLIEGIIKEKDDYGKIIGEGLIRRKIDDSIVSYKDSIPTKIIDFIDKKVVELIKKYPNWEDENNFLDFLVNNVDFFTQTYVSEKNLDNVKKNEVIINIMNIFYKLNTRGKSFNAEEISDIIKKLEKINKSNKELKGNIDEKKRLNQ